MKKEMCPAVSRLDFLDAAKGTGVLLVVAAHGCLLQMPWALWIYEFYMPMFFVVSGYLFGRRRLAEQPAACRRRIGRLVRTYFTGCGILFALWFVLFPLRGKETDRLGKAVFSILYGRMSDAANPMLADVCWVGPLWFLTLMVCAQLLLTMVLRMDNGTPPRRCLLAAALLAAAQLLRLPPVLLPWCVDTAPMAALLMLVSAWLGERQALERPFTRRTAAVCLCLAIPYLLLNDTYDLHMRYYGRWQDVRGTLAFFAAGLCGSLLFLMLCRCLAAVPPLFSGLAALGRESMAVFIGHTFLIWVVDSLFLRLPAFPLSGVVRGAGLLLAGTLVPLAGSLLVKRLRRRTPAAV